jgi:small subunit ribosomal protein S6
MRKYETVFILQPDLGEDEVKSVTEKVESIITTLKGDMVRLENWGSRRLAYPIMKFNRGQYYYLRFDGSPELIAELERRLRLDDRVLRYQSVKLEKEPTKPAAQSVAAPDADEAPEAPEAETTEA